MTILRIKRSKGHTTIPNKALCDARLSFRARGMLAFLLSNPNDWETKTSDLSDQGKEGRDACRAALAELREVGYVAQDRESYQGENGRTLWRTVTVVYDNDRNSAETDSSTFPKTGFQGPETSPDLPESDGVTEDGFSGALFQLSTETTTGVTATFPSEKSDALRPGRRRGSIKTGPPSLRPVRRNAREIAAAAAAEEAALDPSNAPDVRDDVEPPAPERERTTRLVRKNGGGGAAASMARLFEAYGRDRYRADGMPEKIAGAFNAAALGRTFSEWMKDDQVTTAHIESMIATFWSDGFSRDLELAAWRDFLQKKVGVLSQQRRADRAEKTERDRNDPAAWL